MMKSISQSSISLMIMLMIITNSIQALMIENQNQRQNNHQQSHNNINNHHHNHDHHRQHQQHHHQSSSSSPTASSSLDKLSTLSSNSLLSKMHQQLQQTDNNHNNNDGNNNDISDYTMDIMNNIISNSNHNNHNDNNKYDHYPNTDQSNHIGFNAAILSKKNLHVLPLKNINDDRLQKPIFIDIQSNNNGKPNDNYITLRFNTISTKINTIQNHKKIEPKVEKTNFMAEPDILMQTIRKPIIQNVHEIILPYRRVYQEVRPVEEQIETIISKGINNDNHNGKNNGKNYHKSIMNNYQSNESNLQSQSSNKNLQIIENEVDGIFGNKSIGKFMIGDDFDESNDNDHDKHGDITEFMQPNGSKNV